MKHKQHGIFYLLPTINQKHDIIDFKEKFACNIIQKQWRLGKSILITCENKSQAIKINKTLWEYDQDTFIPHDLFRKNTNNIPIVIYWPQCCYNYTPKDVLINLMDKSMHFFLNFNCIIDFVPNNIVLKKWARIRYKTYKQTGFQLQIFNASNYTNN